MMKFRIPLTEAIGMSFSSWIWHLLYVDERGEIMAQCSNRSRIDINSMSFKVRLKIKNSDEFKAGRKCERCVWA